jgi:4-hydroxybenzoate polyprenyltransferase
MAQGALTYLLLDAPINPIIISVLGCSTLLLYNFSLLLSKPVDFSSSPYKRVQWFFSHSRFVISISVIAFLATLLLVTKLSMSSIVLLVSIGVFAISYNFPIFKIGNHRYGLRSIPGVKLFIIAGVWAFSCVWLPIMELRDQGFIVSGMDTFLLVSKRFLFVMAITLPFDIRDLYQDRMFQLKTIPTLIGEKNALLLCQALLFIYLVILFILTKNINPNVLALALTVFLTSFLIFRTEMKKNDYYYFLLLDGTLILQFLTVWMANNLS